MTAALIACCLVAALVCAFVSCLGIVVMQSTLQRLHFVGPISIVAPVLVAVAISISRGPLAGASLKADVIALVCVAFAPILSHETGRAAEASADTE